MLQVPDLMRQHRKQFTLVVLVCEIVRDTELAVPQEFQEKCVLLRRLLGLIIYIDFADLLFAADQEPLNSVPQIAFGQRSECVFG